MISLVGVATPAWSDVQFTPSVALSGLYVDNFYLVPPGVPRTGEWIEEVDPSLQVRQQSAQLVSALDYKLQALWFDGNSSMDTTHSNGRASIGWRPLTDFVLDGWATYVQQPVDPTQSSNDGNLFGVNNIANRLSAYLAPTVRHDFEDYTALLRYSEATSLYSGVGGASGTIFQNSRTGALSAKFGTRDPGNPFTWDIAASNATTTFQTAARFRDDRVAVESALSVSSSLRILARAGAETNILHSSTQGGLNAAFGTLGLDWAPSAYASLEALAGHRFFGNAYSARWTVSSRLLTIQASYTEEPTTDAETDSLVSFVPGELSVDTQAYFGVLRAINTYSPYIRRSADATLSWSGVLTTLSVRGYDLRRHYLQPTSPGGATLSLVGDDSTYGAEIIVSRAFNPRNLLALSARLASADELDGFRYRDHRYAIDFTHHVTPTVDVGLQGVHLQRDGTSHYRADIYRLAFKKTF